MRKEGKCKKKKKRREKNFIVGSKKIEMSIFSREKEREGNLFVGKSRNLSMKKR